MHFEEKRRFGMREECLTNTLASFQNGFVASKNVANMCTSFYLNLPSPSPIPWHTAPEHIIGFSECVRRSEYVRT